jgi:hypothetical protein
MSCCFGRYTSTGHEVLCSALLFFSKPPQILWMCFCFVCFFVQKSEVLYHDMSCCVKINAALKYETLCVTLLFSCYQKRQLQRLCASAFSAASSKRSKRHVMIGKENTQTKQYAGPIGFFKAVIGRIGRAEYPRQHNIQHTQNLHRAIENMRIINYVLQPRCLSKVRRE